MKKILFSFLLIILLGFLFTSCLKKDSVQTVKSTALYYKILDSKTMNNQCAIQLFTDSKCTKLVKSGITIDLKKTNLSLEQIYLFTFFNCDSDKCFGPVTGTGTENYIYKNSTKNNLSFKSSNSEFWNICGPSIYTNAENDARNKRVTDEGKPIPPLRPQSKKVEEVALKTTTILGQLYIINKDGTSILATQKK